MNLFAHALVEAGAAFFADASRLYEIEDPRRQRELDPERRAAAEALASGEYGNRVYVPSRDELGELAGTLNRMSQTMYGRMTQLSQTAARLHMPKATLSRVRRSLKSRSDRAR